MKVQVIDALLAVAVLASWLGAFGFLRLSTALDRLHVAAFVNAVAGAAMLVAVWVADGVSQRAGKATLIWVLMLAAGALVAHASGRALLLRSHGDEG